MDGAAAFGALRLGGGARARKRRARESGRARIDNRSADLADEPWHPGKRAPHRDRSALCVALRARHHFLAELVDAKTLAVADLDSVMDFSWPRLAGQRSDIARLFLCGRAGGALAAETLAGAVSPGAFLGCVDHARDLRGVGGAIL